LTPPGLEHAQIGKHAGKIPIREVSGLTLRVAGPDLEVLAIGDHDFELAIGLLKNGAVEEFKVVDLANAVLAEGLELPKESQWEGITADASGRIFVLEENPGHVFIFDAHFQKLLARIELHFHAHHPDFAELKEAWEKFPNSRGEGLVLLENGHLLILKEKDPSRLIEFGPHKDVPVGLKPLDRARDFILPDKKSSRMVPLAEWKFSKDSSVAFPDLSELKLDHSGNFWVLSDGGRALGQINGTDQHGHLKIDLRVRLSDTPGLEHPEGLALLEPDIALVACDKHEPHTPLYSFILKRKIP
jgi:uncharacterized protein YjiK